jgi:UDP-N-acetylglucosamine diphosphorylase/glucosamine-1-phosphate N-acetyltransferase
MLCLYDDARARTFEPFAFTRPISELRAGTEILRHRWELAAARQATSFAGAEHLLDFEEASAPPALRATSSLPAGTIVANSRFVVALGEKLRDDDSVWECGGHVCAVRLTRPLPSTSLADGSMSIETLGEGPRTALNGRWVTAIWDFVGQLSVQLAEDIAVTSKSIVVQHDAGTTVGSHTVTIEQGATIEPYVVFDAAAGPILVRSGATISSFTRIVGPCFIGHDSVIAGDRVANCSIGEKCKVRGEISSTIILGHSNKGHTGFVGHSYLGRWVNLGAGTTTSNLKNTYGTVQLWTPSGIADTGQQFLGTMFGDHVKTGIGTMLTTGTVLGAGASVYGAAAHPKFVSPFAWGDGDPYAIFEAIKFIDVAERVMRRRGVELGDGLRRHLTLAHARSTKS